MKRTTAIWTLSGVTVMGFLGRTALASGAMTASQRLEMALTGRPPSDFPVRVVEATIGRPVPPGSRVVVGHLAQRSLAAVALALASATRRVHTGPAVGATAFALIAGDAELAMAAGVGEAPWRWQRSDLTVDVLHKAVLAVTARRIAGRV